jgi:hypothetical protein
VQGATNSINSTSGVALNVNGTTITAGTLTFHDISAGNNTAAVDGANGIVLSSTGASGSLIVTGDANAALGGNSSGGVIQHTTGHGISLANTLSPSFTNVSIHDVSQNAINGTAVTNFTFKNGQVTNAGTAGPDQFTQNGIAFLDPAVTANTLSGTVVITQNLISGVRRRAIAIETWNGTISNINISNNTLSGPSLAAALKDATLATTADVLHAIEVLSQGSATQTAHITTGTFNGNTISGFKFLSGTIFIGGSGIFVGGGSGNVSNNAVATIGAAATPIEIANNDVDDVGSNSIQVSFNGQQGLSNFNIHNNGTVANPMSNAEGLGITVFFGGSGTFSALVNNNAIDNNGPTVNAGSAGIGVQLDDGPAGLANATGVATITVNSNTITNPDGFGIRGIVRASNGTLNLRVQNNNVGTPSAANREAIRVDSGSTAGDTTLNMNMSGNSGPLASTTDLLVGSGVDAGIGVRKQGTVATVNDFNIQGIAANPTNAQVQAYLGSPVPPGLNQTAAAGGAAGSNANGNGVDIISGSAYGTTSALPLLFAPAPPRRTAVPTAPSAVVPTAPTGQVPTSMVTVPTASGESAAPARHVKYTPAPLSLITVTLNSMVAAAITRWDAAGITADQDLLLRSVTYSIADLPGWYLGEASPGHVTLDSTAAGNGWFIDRTPTTDNDVPAGKLDLLTTIMHEMGHQLGLADSYLPGDRGSLMYGYLTLGERRLPAMHMADNADANMLAMETGPDFLFTPINIGTLTFGTTITIKFNATIANPLVGTGSVSNQGSVSGTNFTTVNTDDPDVAGTQATVTLVQPATPAIADLQAASDTGSSNTDNITNAANPVFDATGVDAAATVELLRGGVVVATRTGPGALTDTGAPAGTLTYNIRQRFGAGGINSDNSPDLGVTIDRTAPVAPNAPDLQAGSDSGSSTTDNITNDNSPTFDLGGTIEAGAIIQLFRDGATLVGASSGAGSVTDAGPVTDGGHAYTARQVDVAGNAGNPSTGLNVTIDTVANAPTAPDLQAGSDCGASPTYKITKDATLTFDLAGV